MKLTLPQAQLQAADAVNAFYDAAVLWVDAPPAERQELRRRVADIAVAAPKGVTVAMLIPSIDQAISTRTRLISEIRATILVLAIALYRAQYDRLPTTLEELAPSILASIPTDPFAPDGAFRYRIDGDPADRNCQFTIYSVGPDGIDNAGVFREGNSSSPSKDAPDEGRDIVFFPVPK